MVSSSGKREKKKEKKTNQKGRRRRIPERRQGGGGVLERGEGEDAPQSVARKEWGGVVCRRRVRGRLVRGEGTSGARLREFPRVTKSTVGTFPNSATFATSRTVLTPLLPPQVHGPLSLANREGGCPLFS